MEWYKRILRRGHQSRGAVAMVLVVFSAAAEMLALAATSGWAPGVQKQIQPVMAAALIRGFGAPRSSATKTAGDAEAKIVVPSGANQCPSSGAGAACANPKPPAERGTPILPGGMPACPTDSGKPDLGVPGACAPSDSNAVAAGSHATIDLKADRTLLAYGTSVTFQAVSSVNVSGTPYAIEIFDRTTGDLAAACTQSTSCWFAYTGKAGTHVFSAYVVNPTSSVPTTGMIAQSPDVQVQWLGIGLTVESPAVAPPGQPITFTAYASVEVSSVGYIIQFRDANSGRLITYCAQGTTCSTAVIEPNSGRYAVVASLVAREGGHAAADVGTTSAPVGGTWLGVDLVAGSVTGSGASVQLNASANADLSTTPWSIFITTSSGKLIGQPCHAATCAATVPYKAGDQTTYLALIGVQVNKPSHLDVIVRSGPAKPLRVLWGVDSCKESTGLYGSVASAYGGPPDFWGRYLTTTYNCPGISGAEIAAAKAHHMGILPIFDDYDCSNYSGYSTGMGYAQSAVAAARGLGIPAGTGLVVDIEPPGAGCPGAWFVDSSFLEGWFDGITQAHYVPVYYGNTTAGSGFAQGWCGAVAAHPEYATKAFLWSFEPSLIGSWTKAGAPGFGPNWVGCGGDHSAWQYSLSAGSNPDVDVDEALNRLPLWYP